MLSIVELPDWTIGGVTGLQFIELLAWLVTFWAWSMALPARWASPSSWYSVSDCWSISGLVVPGSVLRKAEQPGHGECVRRVLVPEFRVRALIPGRMASMKVLLHGSWPSRFPIAAAGILRSRWRRRRRSCSSSGVLRMCGFLNRWIFGFVECRFGGVSGRLLCDGLPQAGRRVNLLLAHSQWCWNGRFQHHCSLVVRAGFTAGWTSGQCLPVAGHCRPSVARPGQ